jgi:hypothetical protein
MIDLSNAKFNRRVPKKRFKAELTNVDTVIWLYKISAGTADFRYGDMIEEIQVFEVVFKNELVVKREFVVIQRRIPYPILFISHGKSYFIVEGELLESDRLFIDGDNLALERRSAKLTELYEDIAAAFIPIKRGKAESIAELVARYRRLREQEKKIKILQRKVDAEKQPNKRIELNENLKRLKAEMKNLYIMQNQLKI